MDCLSRRPTSHCSFLRCKLSRLQQTRLFPTCSHPTSASQSTSDSPFQTLSNSPPHVRRLVPRFQSGVSQTLSLPSSRITSTASSLQSTATVTATMRQTRAKAKMSGDNNTRSNVTSTSSAKASPITDLLSQYGLLRLVCQHLSSADFIHLGATSREHWQYIGSSPKVLKELIRGSRCDGSGIIAQARVFGHWKGNLDNATRKCKGRDAKSCGDCGAMVCNVRHSRPLCSVLVADWLSVRLAGSIYSTLPSVLTLRTANLRGMTTTMKRLWTESGGTVNSVRLTWVTWMLVILGSSWR